MVAVIQVGGKQYCVTPGQKLVVDRFEGAIGDTVTFENKLGSDSVTAEVVAHVKGDKLIIRKFRNKTRYNRFKGHRQPQTVLAFKDTNAKTKKATAETAEKDA